MKKVLAIFLTAVLMLGLAAVGANADNYIFNQDEDLTVNVKKADPANVIKDGVIGEDEYERFVVNNDPESDDCLLSVVYDSGDNFEKASEMMKTAEFYFSWDETHGFNLAVRFKPETLIQVMGVKEGDNPEDYFLKNTGIALFLDSRHDYGGSTERRDDVFYVALAKRTNDGAYLFGHYNQFGIQSSYNPVAGQDFAIEYGADGYATYEWSIPVSQILTGSYGEGTELFFTLSLMSGNNEDNNGTLEDYYGVCLGYFGYAMKALSTNTHVTAAFSGETITTDNGDNDVPEGDNGGSGSEPDDIGGNTDNGGSGTGNTNAGNTDGTEKGGDVTPVDGGNSAQSGTNNKPATKTGDAMVILAVVSALSAGGVMISKKRR